MSVLQDVMQPIQDAIDRIPEGQPVPLSKVLPTGMTAGTFVKYAEIIALTGVQTVEKLAEQDRSLAYTASIKMLIPLVREIPAEFRGRGISQYIIERVTVQEYVRRVNEPIIRNASKRIMSGLRLSSEKEE